MKLVYSSCLASLPAMSSRVLPVLLFGRADPSELASVGAAIVDDVRRAKLNPTARAWDFLAIALAAAMADLAIPRKQSPNGWTRELTLEIAVTDPDFWNGVATEIQDTLKFLTTDIWDINFLDGGYVFDASVDPQTPEEKCVALRVQFGFTYVKSSDYAVFFAV